MAKSRKAPKWEGQDRAARYLRISDDKAGDAHGVINQRETTSKHVADKGYEVAPGRGPAFTGESGALVQCEAGEYADNDISASKGAPRPGYEALMAAAQRGEFNVIVCFQTSRLLRNRVERAKAIEILSKAGVRIEAVQGMSLDLSTAQGRSMASIGMEFDSMESETKGERVWAAQRAKAMKGEHLGGIRPVGWDIVPDPARAGSPDLAYRLAPVLPVVNPDEARELIRCAEGVVAGRTLAALAGELNAAGWQLPARKRKREGEARPSRWTPSNLREVLLRMRNYGVNPFGDERFDDVWPALAHTDDDGTEHVFTEELYRKVAAKCAEPARRTNAAWHAAGRPVVHLLSGIARCGKCGSPVKAGSQALARGRIAVYKCAAGEHVHRSCEATDYVVSEWIIAWITGMTDDDKRLLLGDEEVPSGPDAEEAAKLRKQIANVKDLAVEGVLTAGEAKAKLAKLRPTLAAAERRMGIVSRRPVLGDLVNADDVRAVWESMPIDRKRAVLREAPPIVIHPGQRGRVWTKGGRDTWTSPESIGVKIGAGGRVRLLPDGPAPWEADEGV